MMINIDIKTVIGYINIYINVSNFEDVGTGGIDGPLIHHRDTHKLRNAEKLQHAVCHMTQKNDLIYRI